MGARRPPSARVWLVALVLGGLACAASSQNERAIVQHDSDGTAFMTDHVASDRQAGGAPASASQGQPQSNGGSGGGSVVGGDWHPCVGNPRSADCSRFAYDQQQAAGHLSSLCGQQPNLVACSLLKRCQSGASKRSIGRQPQTCDAVQLLINACLRDGLQGQQECNQVASMCGAGSQVPACQTAALKHLPTSRGSQQLARSICEQMPSMMGCGRCRWDQSGLCGDVLSVYGQLCANIDSFGECTLWERACSEGGGDPTLFICRVQPDAPPVRGKSNRPRANSSSSSSSSSNFTSPEDAWGLPAPPGWAVGTDSGSPQALVSTAAIALVALAAGLLLQ